MDIKRISVPAADAQGLQAGDFLSLSGKIYCGRDAVLPHIVRMAEEGTLAECGVDLDGAVIFHTAVSQAGIAPTTSAKLEIEGSILPLSKAGVKFHLGKGLIRPETVAGLKALGAYFLVTPPVAALLTAKMSSKRALVHPEFGMEAFYEIEVEDFPAIVAAADGKTIFPA